MEHKFRVNNYPKAEISIGYNVVVINKDYKNKITNGVNNYPKVENPISYNGIVN